MANGDGEGGKNKVGMMVVKPTAEMCCKNTVYSIVRAWHQRSISKRKNKDINGESHWNNIAHVSTPNGFPTKEQATIKMDEHRREGFQIPPCKRKDKLQMRWNPRLHSPTYHTALKIKDE